MTPIYYSSGISCRIADRPVPTKPIPLHRLARAYRLDALNGINYAWGHPEMDRLPDSEPASYRPFTPAPKPTAPAEAPAPIAITNIRDLKAAPLAEVRRQYWSKGQPALPTPVRPRHEAHKDPSAMSLQELIATQDQEIPSISYEAYSETGQGVLSMDGYRTTLDDGNGTLADVVADEHWLREAYPEAFDEDADPALAQHVYDLWLDDEAMAVRYGKHRTAQAVPIAPEVRDRIDWEQYVSQCSDVQREGFRFDPKAGTLSFFSLVGRRLSGAEFTERKAAFVAAFLKRIGRDTMPGKSEFAQKRAMFADPGFRRATNRIARMQQQVTEALLALENERHYALDSDAETSAQAIDHPYIPSLSVFIYRETKARAATEPEYGTAEWRRWKDEAVRAAQQALSAWLDAHLDDPQPVVRWRSRNHTDLALWHQERFVQTGPKEFTLRAPLSRIALGTHKVRLPD